MYIKVGEILLRGILYIQDKGWGVIICSVLG
jgi:hypothetical protein